jgi:hypothetical protein
LHSNNFTAVATPAEKTIAANNLDPLFSPLARQGSKLWTALCFVKQFEPGKSRPESFAVVLPMRNTAAFVSTLIAEL